MLQPDEGIDRPDASSPPELSAAAAKPAARKLALAAGRPFIAAPRKSLGSHSLSEVVALGRCVNSHDGALGMMFGTVSRSNDHYTSVSGCSRTKKVECRAVLPG